MPRVVEPVEAFWWIARQPDPRVKELPGQGVVQFLPVVTELMRQGCESPSFLKYPAGKGRDPGTPAPRIEAGCNRLKSPESGQQSLPLEERSPDSNRYRPGLEGR